MTAEVLTAYCGTNPGAAGESHPETCGPCDECAEYLTDWSKTASGQRRVAALTEKHGMRGTRALAAV